MPGFTQANPRGWCWQDDAILPDEFAEALDALTTGTDTFRVNALYTQMYCDGQQPGLKKAQCIALMFSDFYDALVAEGLFSPCVWPTNNFVPVDCLCNFSCTDGYVACGRQCIDPTIEQCVSNFPQPKRRSLSTKCPRGYDKCALPTGGFDCVDVDNDLESCGGCPSYGDDEDSVNARGVDCSVLPGVASVACVKGECRVGSCLRKHRLVHNACLPV
ncbi:Protein priA [Vanrija pseudolonga]|uniref:Protein priA n=1 Tax=Vanrija pseudolonga TaxID=143232 RepID=A0AAF0YG65_9TREE|nr:Protein priA [Vanrija pseudolonga]